MSNFRRYYQENNIVFITLVTYNRQKILIKNIDLLKNCLRNINYKFKIIAGIILEDHLHILIKTGKAEDLPKIIASFKSSFSKNFPFNERQTQEQKLRREKGIWQRKYYDHIIRDEGDLNRHLDYIHFNSMKHNNIVPKDWKYSSFNKFVKLGYYNQDWCNLDDKNKILDLNFE